MKLAGLLLLVFAALCIVGTIADGLYPAYTAPVTGGAISVGFLMLIGVIK